MNLPTQAFRRSVSHALEVYEAKPSAMLGWASHDKETNTLVCCDTTQDGKTLEVACRGTVPKSWRNWKTNFKFFGGPYHPGIKAAADSHCEQIKCVIEKVRPTKVVISGHSLGGAIATHLFEEIQCAVQECLCCTYGAVASRSKKEAKEFNLLFKHKVYRFVNNNDLVPRLLMITRAHVGYPIHFDHNGKVRLNYKGPGKFFDSVVGRFKSFRTPLKPDGIEDHDIKVYKALVHAFWRFP